MEIAALLREMIWKDADYTELVDGEKSCEGIYD